MSEPSRDPEHPARILQQVKEDRLSGNTDRARDTLMRFVRDHPRNEEGWLLLANTLSDPKHQIDCLKRVLSINPGNMDARHAVEKLQLLKSTIETPPPSPKNSIENRKPVSASPFTVDINEIDMVEIGRLAETQQVRSQEYPFSPEELEGFTAAQQAARKSNSEVKPSASGGQKHMQSSPKTGISTGVQQQKETAQAAAFTISHPAERIPSAEPRETIKGSPTRGCLVFSIIGFLLMAGGIGAFLVWGDKLPALESFVNSGNRTAIPTLTPVELTMPPKWTDTPTATISPTSSITRTPTQTTTPTLASPKESDLDQMREIMREVDGLRGLIAAEEIPIFLINKNRAEGIFQRLVDEGGYREQIFAEKVKYIALGLINPTYRLEEYAFERMTGGVLGFYLPEDKSIYVIGTSFGSMERLVFSHEYDHALVSHNYPIVADILGDPLCASDSQRCEAITALMEGDAMLIEALWYEQYASPEDRIRIGRYQAPYQPLPKEYPPPFAYQQMMFPYFMGFDFVQYLHSRGSWAEVNRVYEQLPVSTEQIMHPAKYLSGEPPIAVEAPDLEPVLGSGWVRAVSDSMGEFMTILMLSFSADLQAQIPVKDALDAAAGWGGDRYQVFYRGTENEVILAAEWVWDTGKDAEEFRAALENYMHNRFRGGRIESASGECWTVNLQTGCIFFESNRNLLFLAPDLDLINAMRPLY